mgnify:CR=1 FL=1
MRNVDDEARVLSAVAIAQLESLEYGDFGIRAQLGEMARHAVAAVTGADDHVVVFVFNFRMRSEHVILEGRHFEPALACGRRETLDCLHKKPPRMRYCVRMEMTCGLLASGTQHNACVGDGKAVFQGKDRVQIHFGDVSQFIHHIGNRGSRPGQGRNIARLLSAYAAQHGGSFDFLNHAQAFRHSDGSDPEGDILENFHKDAAESEHDDWSEGGILNGADDAFHAARQHGGEHHAEDAGVSPVFQSVRYQSVIRGRLLPRT